MTQNFNKRIYTLSLLIKDIEFLRCNAPNIAEAKRNKRISESFKEKIVLICSAINGCRYCKYFHAKQAISCGISEEEVKNMLNLQFEADATEFEIIGLLYAQHYAETNRKPDKEMTDKLFDYYGDEIANDIILVIRVIFAGNLGGNTIDAFLSRLKGNKAKNSNIIFEFFFFIIVYPSMKIKQFLRKK